MSQHAQTTIRPSFHGTNKIALSLNTFVNVGFQLSTLIINSYVRRLSSYDLCQSPSFLSFDPLNHFKILSSSTTTQQSHRVVAQLVVCRTQIISEANASSISTIALDGKFHTGEFLSNSIHSILSFRERLEWSSRISCTARNLITDNRHHEERYPPPDLPFTGAGIVGKHRIGPRTSEVKFPQFRIQKT
jgi:hypothetical protein